MFETLISKAKEIAPKYGRLVVLAAPASLPSSARMLRKKQYVKGILNPFTLNAIGIVDALRGADETTIDTSAVVRKLSKSVGRDIRTLNAKLDHIISGATKRNSVKKVTNKVVKKNVPAKKDQLTAPDPKTVAAASK